MRELECNSIIDDGIIILISDADVSMPELELLENSFNIHRDIN